MNSDNSAASIERDLFSGLLMMAAKERKERRADRQESITASFGSFPAHRVFLNLKFVAAKVDEQPVLDLGRLEVAENLRSVLVGQCTARFQFYDQAALDQQVGQILADECAVLVINFEWVLLFDFNASLAQPICQGVFIDFLQVPVPMVHMDGIGVFSHNVTEFIDRFHLLRSLRSFAANCFRLERSSTFRCCLDIHLCESPYRAYGALLVDYRLYVSVQPLLDKIFFGLSFCNKRFHQFSGES